MCLFGVPRSVGPLRLVFSFISNQAACLLLLHPVKPYRGVNVPYQHFISVAYLDVTELFQSWLLKHFSPGATIRGMVLARYLQLHAIRLQRHTKGWVPPD